MRCAQALPLCLLIFTAPAVAEDWTQFRGPGGSGVSEAQNLPVKWSSTENILWKAELPGPGTSSPIVLGDRVYLTSYSGYGLVPGEGEMKDLRRHLVCVDLASGEIVLDRKFEPVLPESKYGRGNSSHHGYASSTLMTDGKRLFAFFGKSGVYCLELDGKEVWQTSVGTDTHGWGSSNSPVLYKDLVIVNASVESKSLVALNSTTGEEVWRAENIRRAWNTPVLCDVPGSQTELIVSETESVLGINPDSGEELWRVTGFGGYVCPSVVARDGIVYVVRNKSLAIRAGGRGDVTGTHVMWTGRGRSVVPSPVAYGDYVYVVSRGTATCLDADDGSTVYQERLRPQPRTVYSSVLAADGKLYCVTQRNGVYVLSAGADFEQLAHNTFVDDDSRTNSSAIAIDGQILLRTDRFLYCIGEE